MLVQEPLAYNPRGNDYCENCGYPFEPKDLAWWDYTRQLGPFCCQDCHGDAAERYDRREADRAVWEAEAGRHV